MVPPTKTLGPADKIFFLRLGFIREPTILVKGISRLYGYVNDLSYSYCNTTNWYAVMLFVSYSCMLQYTSVYLSLMIDIQFVSSHYCTLCIRTEDSPVDNIYAMDNLSGDRCLPYDFNTLPFFVFCYAY